LAQSAWLTKVVLAILADGEPVRPARRKKRNRAINLVTTSVSAQRTVFPASGTPAATFSDRLRERRQCRQGMVGMVYYRDNEHVFACS
jgi:hypothetical protein